MYNSHIHTSFSSDCGFDAFQMCSAATAQGMSGIAITDHCRIDNCITENVFRNTMASVNAAREVSEKFPELKVAAGVEISEAFHKPDYAVRLLKSIDFDIVLLSVHSITRSLLPVPLSRIDFSSLDNDEINNILLCYFKDLLYSVRETDFDVCSHLTLPFRYINGVYHKSADVYRYIEHISQILSEIVKRDKALELNTSELNRQLYDFMPNEKIVTLYKSLGGKYVTIGSDAHTPENISLGLREAQELLKRVGFDSYTIYEHRKPMQIKI